MSDHERKLGTCPPGETPYSAYIQTEALHSLQNLVSDSPAEPAFIVNVQVSELYWALITKELQTAQRKLREDNIAETNRVFHRIVNHMVALNANWRSLSWLTPSELMPILRGLQSTHGKDSALQGWSFRHMVFLMGIKQRHQLDYFASQPKRMAQLSAALEEPSIYDDVLAALARSGAAVPQSQIARDYAEPYVADSNVAAVWHQIYIKNDPADHWRAMAELLADIAVEFTNWKYLHLMATRRTFGGRPAYHGEDAIGWLLPTMEEIPFPEVWAARGMVD
ncbi:tryptophan 2,3-dioxygenase [Phyllobacterium bourgognense]|uniref:Tryptophan 2,3-dioxygenase n=1 Tax=Phyllobacterium bourgognense TaxID=314236 RepID=A0A368YUT8_9HYPH|nr:tryptophan 2,3-dioxygenase family protein [Phyllobacterium bourgognense]RCW81944.1 tryptophan 2,3-dioxygenase [Phyllobacterium bourgognense]